MKKIISIILIIISINSVGCSSNNISNNEINKMKETIEKVLFYEKSYDDEVSDYIDEKVEILELYKSEVHESPFPRSVDAIIALAKYRGASCYSHYAEAFRIVKEVER